MKCTSIFTIKSLKKEKQNNTKLCRMRQKYKHLKKQRYNDKKQLMIINIIYRRCK